MTERLPETLTEKDRIIGKYGILSQLSIERINEDPEGFKKFIEKHRRLSRFHGTAEAAAGAMLLLQVSHLRVTDEATLLTYIFLVTYYSFGTYVTIEGALDMITGQRKHELTSTILEKLRLDKINYHCSVPRTSELKKLIE